MSLEGSNATELSSLHAGTWSDDAARDTEAQPVQESSASERVTREFAILSILDLAVDRSRFPWVRLVVGFGLSFALIALLTAYAENLLPQMLATGEWRYFMSIPVIMVYMLLNIDNLAYLRMDVVTPLRPLIQLDDTEYNKVFQDATRVRPRRELIAMALGAPIAAAMFFSFSFPMRYFTYWLWLLGMVLTYSLLSWIVYRVVINARLIAVLNAQPMQVDVFDIAPFEPVGRHSLRFSATFLGAVALSAIFLVSRDAMLAPQFWIAYTVMIVIPVVGFFLGMRQTHRVLADAKQRELEMVKQRIANAYATMTLSKAEGQNVDSAAREINAWFACQHELKGARTWPYNTETLRTLVISVMVPISAGLVKVLGPWLAGRM